MFYGRAELKQSDHRPVIAVVDVQVGVTMMVIIVSDDDDDGAGSGY